MLIAFGGLPGTGKTSISKRLAQRLTAVYLRLDTLETVILNSDPSTGEIGPTGYFVAYAVAAENLSLGLSVIADSVNGIQITREAWRNVANEGNVRFVEIEIICSDKRKHQQRIESRTTDIVNLKLPTWLNILERQYDVWESKHLVIDTANISIDEAVEKIVQHLNTF
jgi:predicted kinase